MSYWCSLPSIMARVRAEIRHENLEGGDEAFPHIYGPLNADFIAEVKTYGTELSWGPSAGTGRLATSAITEPRRQSLRDRTTRNIGSGPASGCAASWRVLTRGLGAGSATSSIVRLWRTRELR